MSLKYVIYCCHLLTFKTVAVCSLDHAATVVLLCMFRQCCSITPTTSAIYNKSVLSVLLAKWSSIKAIKRVNTKRINTQDGAWQKQKSRVCRCISDDHHSSTVAAWTPEADHVLDLTSSHYHLAMLSAEADVATASDPCLRTVYQLDGQLSVGCDMANTQTNLRSNNACILCIRRPILSSICITYFIRATFFPAAKIKKWTDVEKLSMK